MRLLIVEDEPELGSLLAKNLARDGFAIDLARTLEEAECYLDTTVYALILLDLGLPDGFGLELIKRTRHLPERPPVIVVTASGAVQDRVRGLNEGADDYLGKPFAHAELLARVKAVLRRPGNTMKMVLQVGEVALDTVSRTVSVRGAALTIPRRELGMLELLLRRPGQLITRDAMQDAIYDYGEEPCSNAIEANISRLRKRLRDHDGGVEIQSLRGLGYLLRPETVLSP